MADEIWDVRVKYEPPDVEYEQDSPSFHEIASEDESKIVSDSTEDDLKLLTPGKTNAYTIRSTKASVKLFRDFLAEKGESVEFEQFSKSKLCSILRIFYIEARKKNGDFYSTSSLNAMRFGINRHLQSVRRNIDILTDLEFTDANRAYRIQIAELKKRGKAAINRRQHFSMVDLLKLYFSPVFDTNSADGLLRKVFFDVLHMLYRRPACDGSMSLRELRRDRFVVGNLGDRKCVFPRKKSDEDAPVPGKNVMFEITGHPRCPVASFEKYLSKMNPHNPWLWQKPRKSVDECDDVWYEAVAVGHNTLGEMMATISKSAKLSFVYTNQCIRITPISLLETILKDTMPSNNLTECQQQKSSANSQNSLTSIATPVSATKCLDVTVNNFLSATSPVSTATQKGSQLNSVRPTMVTLPPLLPKTSQACKSTTPLCSEQPLHSKVNCLSVVSNSDASTMVTSVGSLSGRTDGNTATTPSASQVTQPFTVMQQSNSVTSQPLVVMAGDQNKTFALVPVNAGTTNQVLTRDGSGTGLPSSATRSPLTVRAQDTASGLPAKSLHVQLFTQESSNSSWKLLASGITNNEGRVNQLLTQDQFSLGRYLMRFDTEAYFTANSIDNFFYPRIELEFVIKDTSEACHVPLYFSPFSFSTYKERN